MKIPDRDAHRDGLRARIERYRRANLLRRVAMRLTGEAPTPREFELLRRTAIGGEGRVAEDVLRAVAESEPIWSLLAEKDLPEDLTVRELHRISAAVRCAPGWTVTTDAIVSASFMFAAPSQLNLLRQAIPGTVVPDEISGYRYVTLMPRGADTPEPFIVAFKSNGVAENTVVATMLVAATFLRYEQELGALAEHAVDYLEIIVREDLREIIRTRELLRDA